MDEARSTFESLRRALEAGDGDCLAALFADDAVLLVYDCDNPPSSPMELQGAASIAALLRDELARPAERRIEDEVVGELRFSFTETCRYRDGTRLVGAAVCELRDGKIARHVLRESWDY